MTQTLEHALERHDFQAEVKQLLDLMVHSLYSDKDIFLRELVSNASDALDKRRFEQLTRTDLPEPGELHIRLEADPIARTLSIIDNGIGMSRDEVVKHIGTIARSGTKEFLAAVAASKREGDGATAPGLIGQFGVGFYSSFMVADKVVLVTRRLGGDQVTRWESTGDGAYLLGDGERAEVGTTVTLHLKPVDDEHGLHDYTSDSVVSSIVKRYSDFVGYPIKMRRASQDPADAGKLEDRTLNSMKAIWDRPKGEVTDAEYRDFYRHISHDWTDPLKSIPVRMEGTFEAYALLYLPARAPFDLYNPEMKRGLQLYVKRVFVMDECKELLPAHLRFVRGVVDAHDLSLNVSREILQKDRQIQLIRKQLVKKVLATLDELKRDNRAEYQTFWSELGPVLKEGLATYDSADQDKLLDLVLAASTRDEAAPTSLGEYVERMKEGQPAIYFLIGNKETVGKSPLLERFKEQGYEVLLFSDPIDEFWLDHAPEFQGKPLKSIARGDVELGSEDERKEKAAALDEQKAQYGDLLARLRALLQEQVKAVRLSSRLTSSPACVVGDEHDPSPRMVRMLTQLGQAPPLVKPVLELNAGHPLVAKLQAAFAADAADPRLELYARLLLGQAQLADGGELPDPDAFTRALTDIMVRAL
ncbi:MAG TPA: molecular chaperone HtpG [Kofleriaceae bacterium]|nr:molecular chaperone HtpG [Kofleriaceae bacterium]